MRFDGARRCTSCWLHGYLACSCLPAIFVVHVCSPPLLSSRHAGSLHKRENVVNMAGNGHDSPDAPVRPLQSSTRGSQCTVVVTALSAGKQQLMRQGAGLRQTKTAPRPCCAQHFGCKGTFVHCFGGPLQPSETQRLVLDATSQSAGCCCLRKPVVASQQT